MEFVGESAIKHTPKEEIILCEKERFLKMCKDSPFVIIGFIKNTFMNKVNTIQLWEKDAIIENIVQARNSARWPMHPVNWMRLNNAYFNDMVNQIKKII